MKSISYIRKGVFVILLAMGIQAVYAAFSISGLSDERAKGKYSLKNLSSLSHKSLSFGSLGSRLQYKGIGVQQPALSKETVNGIEITSSLRFDNGNTTYIMPYKFKIKTSKFKTPAPLR